MRVPDQAGDVELEQAPAPRTRWFDDGTGVHAEPRRTSCEGHPGGAVDGAPQGEGTGVRAGHLNAESAHAVEVDLHGGVRGRHARRHEVLRRDRSGDGLPGCANADTIVSNGIDCSVTVTTPVPDVHAVERTRMSVAAPTVIVHDREALAAITPELVPVSPITSRCAMHGYHVVPPSSEVSHVS